MSSVRRQYLVAMLLIAIGAVGIWWSMSQPWVDVAESVLGVDPSDDTQMGAATVVTTYTGARLLPAAAAMPVLLLAGIAGTVGSRGVGRRIVGAAIAIAAAAVVGSIVWSRSIGGFDVVVDAPDSSTYPLMPVMAVCGAVLAGLGGLVVLIRGAAWPSLGRTYERTDREPRDAWEALDRGVDPTVGPDPQQHEPSDGHRPPTR